MDFFLFFFFLFLKKKKTEYDELINEFELENTYHYVINLLNEFENKLYACIKGNDLIIANIINKLRNIAMTSFGAAYNLLLNFKKN